MVLVLALVIGQVSGVLYLGGWTVLGVGALIWVVDAALIYVGVGTFQRSKLIAKL